MRKVHIDTPATASQPLSWAHLRPSVVVLLCLLPAVAVPATPLIDFYAHTLRYDILAGAIRDPGFVDNYRVAWKLLPNLGFDMLGALVFRVLPNLVAAKVLLMLVIAAPAVGVAVLSRCVHGRVSLVSVALAGIVAHNFVLGWGFANFLLGLGLSLSALGLWIATADRPRRQLAIAVPFGVVIFMTHGFMFALWGLLLFSVEVMAAYRNGRLDAGGLLLRAARLLGVAVAPALMFLATDTSQATGGVTDAFTNLASHADAGNLMRRVIEEVWLRVDAALRVADSNWPVADRIFGLVLWGTIALGLWFGRFRLDRRLRLAASAMVVLTVAVPPAMFGVGHLPERLPLVLLAVLAGGMASAHHAPAKRTPTRLVALLLPLHLLMVTLGWTRERETYASFLETVDTLPDGGIGTVAYAPGAEPRDEMRGCKPLTFLMGMTRRVSVPTFANPTQQPLEIVGPLAAAMAAYDAREAAAPGLSGRAQVAAMLGSGYDYIVLCTGRHVGATNGYGGTPPAVDGAAVTGSGPGWILYRATQG